MIPLLYTTHNRLDFTKKTLPQLFKNTLGNVLFVILDTGSDDGTVEYLQHNIKKLSNKKKYKLFLKEDMRVSEAMDFFFAYTQQYDFQYAAKVDNDTLVPKNWLTNLVNAAKDNNIDILQSKHYIMNNSVKNWNEWVACMTQVPYNMYTLFFNDFVGGSGIVFNKKTMIPFSDNADSQRRLHGWTVLQVMHKEWVKAFYDGVFIDLLDMKDDNVLDASQYPEYYELTQRVVQKVVGHDVSTKLPLVSILIPNKEGRKVICIDSIKTQTYQNIEYLISIDIGYGKNWAINKGLQMLTGKYIFICDDDVTLNNDIIQKMVQVLENNDDISFTYCDYAKTGLFTGVLKSEEFNSENLKKYNYISEMSLVRMKDFVYRDESIRKYTDWDYWRTLVAQGKKGKYIPEILFSAYYSNKCLSSMPGDETKKWYDKICLKHS